MNRLAVLSSEQFDAFALTHPKGNWHQTSRMAAFRVKLGWDVHVLGMYEGKKLRAATLLAGKGGRYEITMGPLLDFTDAPLIQDFLTLLTDYVKSLKGHTLEVYPEVIYATRERSGTILSGPDTTAKTTLTGFKRAGYTHKGFSIEYDLVANRWVYVKDLSGIKNEDALLMSYRQTTRQIIKKFEPARYSVKKLTYDELPVLKKLVDASNDKNGVPGRNLSYYQHLYTELGDAAEFLVVYYDDTTPLSGAVFIHHPAETIYFMSGTDTRYRQLYGGHYLQHYAMLQAMKRKQSRYNFYGVSGHFEHNPLLVYKAGFKGHVEEYVGGFYRVIRPIRHHAKKIARRAKNVIRKAVK